MQNQMTRSFNFQCYSSNNCEHHGLYNDSYTDITVVYKIRQDKKGCKIDDSSNKHRANLT